MINYAPLWETLKRKGLKKYYLQKNGLDNRTIMRLKNNMGITTTTLEKICRLLECEPSDVFYFDYDPE